jgi:DNA repair exonuclease SbcCD ATPase subunit
MIRIKKVKANSFFSLGDVELDFENGVYLVFGKNYDDISDSTVVSNGAGKTALFNAVYQGLFNKNLKDPKGTLATTNNLYLGKPYSITVELDINSDEFTIINDRNTNKIVILKNGEDISPKGITNQLTLIKNLLGFDAGTFMSLTFLNQASLDSIIDISSKDNIVYQFFNIDQLKILEKNIKAQVKSLKEDLFLINSKRDSINKTISLLSSVPDINEEELIERKLILQDSLVELENSPLYKGIKSLERAEGDKKAEFREFKSKLDAKRAELRTYKELQAKFSDGVCPICQSDVSSKASSLEEPISKLEEEIEALIKDKLNPLKEDIQEISSKLEKAVNRYEEKRKAILKEVGNINAKLLAYKETLTAYKKIEENKDSYLQELKELDVKYQEVNDYLAYLRSALSVIKSGAIVEEYLSKYTKLLGYNIAEIIKHSSFNFKVRVFTDRGRLVYKILDDGQIKSFTQLSSGERTRVSLTILLATLKTIEQLTGVEINFLVLDELLGVLDEEGVEFLKTVINELRGSKSIFIITHHGEIDLDYADRKVIVKKRDNISAVEVQDV